MKHEDSVPEIVLLSMSDIHPSPNNPRKTFSEDSLQELADNIRQQGLLQPITVRYTVKSDPKTGREMYEIVCGERRYRACLKLGMTEIPCIVRDMTDDEAFDAMITENLQRRDVDPIEEAVAFRLLHERGESPADLAARFGKSVRYIQDRMRLSSLLEPIRNAVSAGDIPIRGGYLLARLSEEEQQEWLDEEFDPDGEGDISVNDVINWLDNHFRNIRRASFQNGVDLSEDWNTDGKLIRRCDTCECNTCNHGCLFADMNSDEPQCIDEVCYSKKVEVYIDWLVSQNKQLLLCGKEKPSAGRVALLGDADSIYNKDMKALFLKLKEKYTAEGYAFFTDRQLPNRVYSNQEEEFKDGRAIRCIDIYSLLHGYNAGSPYSYRRIPGTESASASSVSYPKQLAGRAASIAIDVNKKMNDYARKNFDRDKYVARTVALEDWELDIISIIVYNSIGVGDSVRKKFISGIPDYASPTFRQMHEFRKKQGEYGDVNRWMRHAISCFVQRRDDCMHELLTKLDPLAAPTFSKIRKDADKRIQAINDELRELGYDENGNEL